MAGAAANRAAACRRGSIDWVEPSRDRSGRTLIATGDLHDNPIHFARLVEVAGMGGGTSSEAARQGESEAGSEQAASPSPPGLAASLPRSLAPPSHLVLHEIIHSDRLINGMDFSYRALARVAALKAEFPEHVHTLLANHELAQVVGAGIVKDGVKVVEAFNDALDYVFADEAPRVAEAIAEFVKSMPLALRCVGGGGSGAAGAGGGGREILCAHSLPAPWMMNRFDPGILRRELTEADYEPRRGSAHLMVWGRGHDPEQLEDLVERWGVNFFILGHEHAEHGAMFVPPCAIVLNSDHERGVYLPIDLERPPRAEEAMGMVVGLRG